MDSMTSKHPYFVNSASEYYEPGNIQQYAICPQVPFTGTDGFTDKTQVGHRQTAADKGSPAADPAIISVSCRELQPTEICCVSSANCVIDY